MLQDELKEIRTQLRLAMNGVISTSMREKGIVYKLNFGVPLPEIKQIAATHKPDSELAAALWKEDIREFKILASLLQPGGGFSSRKAEQWVKSLIWKLRSSAAIICFIGCRMWKICCLGCLLMWKTNTPGRWVFWSVSNY